MPSEIEEFPSHPEVRKQLERLLRSKALRGSPSQSGLLDFVVMSALNNTDIREADITNLLVSKDHPNPEPSNARATATNLRKTLARHYGEEGEDDTVVIELPPGRAYKPQFSYNSRSKACQAYKCGIMHMTRFFSAEDARLAIEYLEDAVQRQPTYALAYSARADAQFREALYRADAIPAIWIESARKSAQDALLLDPRSWRAHVVLGAVHCSHFRWDEAKAQFDAAIDAGPLETAEHFYYLAFLAATGKAEEALKLAHARWRRHREDPFAGFSAAALAYITRDAKFYAAYSHTWAGIRQNRSLWAGYALQSCVATGVASVAGGLLGSTARGHIDDAHKLLGMEVFQGLAILSASPMWLMDQSGNNVRARTATLHPQVARLEILSRESYVPPLQLALAHMAVNELEEAVSDLARACEEGDPKMVWLHLWPLFDPLRERPDFQALLMRCAPHSSTRAPTDQENPRFGEDAD